MEDTIDFNKFRLREDILGKVVYSHLKEKYPIVVKVECVTEFFHWNNPKFHFFIDVDYSRQDVPESFYNDRIIKKEVSNLCRYILGEHECFGRVYFNSVIPTP